MQLVEFRDYVAAAEALVSHNPLNLKRVAFVSSEDPDVIKEASRMRRIDTGGGPVAETWSRCTAASRSHPAASPYMASPDRLVALLCRAGLSHTLQRHSIRGLLLAAPAVKSLPPKPITLEAYIRLSLCFRRSKCIYTRHVQQPLVLTAQAPWRTR